MVCDPVRRAFFHCCSGAGSCVKNLNARLDQRGIMSVRGKIVVTKNGGEVRTKARGDEIHDQTWQPFRRWWVNVDVAHRPCGNRGVRTSCKILHGHDKDICKAHSLRYPRLILSFHRADDMAQNICKK